MLPDDYIDDTIVHRHNLSDDEATGSQPLIKQVQCNHRADQRKAMADAI